MRRALRNYAHWVLMGCALFLVFLLFPIAASAHKPSDSYLNLTVAGSEVKGQWDIALRDIDYAMGLDTDDDGAITWDELRTREAELAAYAFSRLRVASGGEPCPLRLTTLMVDRHSDGAYAVLRFSGACSAEIKKLTAEYRLFFDLDPQHRGLASITAAGVTRTSIFSPERARQQFDIGASTLLSQFAAFLSEGVSHIGSGVDHLLFLLALLLPAMFMRTKEGLQPVARFTDAFWNVFKIVTSFTVAHSVTLSLAALQVVALPSRWVETAIAVSVLLAAVNNIYPMVQRRLWLVAFIFGLIHGFGFASVLLDMGLPRDALVLSLLGFNLGVELGQILVVIIFFLLVYPVRKTRFYRRAVVPGGSALIALIAVVWILERALDLKLFPS